MLLFNGDVLGASGIVSTTVLDPVKAINDPSMTWKLVFLSSFLLLSNLALSTHFTDDERFAKDTSIPVPSTIGYLLAGGLVGFGTRLGNGCTSGHGVCGMARISMRSIAAVCTFMVTGFATASFTAPDNEAARNMTEFLRTSDVPESFSRWLGFGVSLLIVLPTIIALIKNYTSDKEMSESPSKLLLNTEKTPNNPSTVSNSREKQTTAPKDDKTMINNVAKADASDDDRRKLLPGAIGGALFALGLAVSGMVYQSKVLGFLNLYLIAQGTYDPTLLLVMGGACVISFVSYQFVSGFGVLFKSYARTCPLATTKFSVPTNTVIDAQLLGGAVCFGLGWGLAGICPGPAIYLAAVGARPIIFYWWPAFLVGSFVAQKLKARL